MVTNPIFLAGRDPDAHLGMAGPASHTRLCILSFLVVSFLCLCLRTVIALSPALPQPPLA